MEVICGKMPFDEGKSSLLPHRLSSLWAALRYKYVVLLELPLFTTLGSKRFLAPPKIKTHLELRRFPNVEDVHGTNSSTKGHGKRI